MPVCPHLAPCPGPPHTEGSCRRAAPVSRAVTSPRTLDRYPPACCLLSLGLDQGSAHLFTKGLSSQQGCCCIRKTATDTKS